jgi:hypothetical protein
MLTAMTDRAVQQRVFAEIDATDLVDLASALIRIPSFKTEETPVARFLVQFFRERDYRVELQEIEPGRFQTLATLPGTGGGASLMLNGHTDINALTRRWRRDPWTPVLEGESIGGIKAQLTEPPFSAPPSPPRRRSSPTDKASCSYTVLWNSFKRLTSGFSTAEKTKLFHDTAARVYRL